jgi:hypothetical protein
MLTVKVDPRLGHIGRNPEEALVHIYSDMQKSKRPLAYQADSTSDTSSQTMSDCDTADDGMADSEI